jgi:hypothetical protein
MRKLIKALDSRLRGNDGQDLFRGSPERLLWERLQPRSLAGLLDSLYFASFASFAENVFIQ